MFNFVWCRGNGSREGIIDALNASECSEFRQSRAEEGTKSAVVEVVGPAVCMEPASQSCPFAAFTVKLCPGYGLNALKVFKSHGLISEDFSVGDLVGYG